MVRKWNVTIPSLSGEAARDGYIYLPESYNVEPQRQHPVLYMFDGHNVFFDEDATFGKSWGMKSYMDATGKDLIIVGVACNNEGNRRLSEYSPVSFDYGPVGHIRGQGKKYMDWLVRDLKPWVDSHYRTLPNRENTWLAGSSMGGLMSLYGVCAYNQYFSKAACLSPSLWVAPGKILELVAKASLSPDTCIYMDYGASELPNHVGSDSALMTTMQLLLTKGVNPTLRIIPGGTHCEASWERQIPIFMEILGA